jgi:hypothetical protein
MEVQVLNLTRLASTDSEVTFWALSLSTVPLAVWTLLLGGGFVHRSAQLCVPLPPALCHTLVAQNITHPPTAAPPFLSFQEQASLLFLSHSVQLGGPDSL